MKDTCCVYRVPKLSPVTQHKETPSTTREPLQLDIDLWAAVSICNNSQSDILDTKLFIHQDTSKGSINEIVLILNNRAKLHSPIIRRCSAVGYGISKHPLRALDHMVTTLIPATPPPCPYDPVSCPCPLPSVSAGCGR